MTYIGTVRPLSALKIGIIQSCILQMRKLTSKEMKEFVSGHKSENWRGDLGSGP